MTLFHPVSISSKVYGFSKFITSFVRVLSFDADGCCIFVRSTYASPFTERFLILYPRLINPFPKLVAYTTRFILRLVRLISASYSVIFSTLLLFLLI